LLHNLAELNVDNCPLASSFDEYRPAFTLSSDMKNLIASRNQKLIFESNLYSNNATIDIINEFEQCKKCNSNTSSLSISCEQNQNDFSIFDFNHSQNKNSLCQCHFFNDIISNKVNYSSTTLNQEIETETLTLSDDNDNNTIEEPINNEDKIELKIPTLKELAARTIVRNHLSMSTNFLHENLLNYLLSYKTCSFCHGPYFETYVRRVRILHKAGNDIPFEYRLCRVHFNTNEERIREMFKVRPITSPRSLNTLNKSKSKDANSSINNNASVQKISSSTSDLNIFRSKSLSFTNSLNSQQKGKIKHLLNITSKHLPKKLSKNSMDGVEYFSNKHNSNKKYPKEINEKDNFQSKSLTVNELLNMKQPSLPYLHFPSSMNDLKNI